MVKGERVVINALRLSTNQVSGLQSSQLVFGKLSNVLNRLSPGSVLCNLSKFIAPNLWKLGNLGAYFTLLGGVGYNGDLDNNIPPAGYALCLLQGIVVSRLGHISMNHKRRPLELTSLESSLGTVPSYSSLYYCTTELNTPSHHQVHSESLYILHSVSLYVNTHIESSHSIINSSISSMGFMTNGLDSAHSAGRSWIKTKVSTNSSDRIKFSQVNLKAMSIQNKTSAVCIYYYNSPRCRACRQVTPHWSQNRPSSPSMMICMRSGYRGTSHGVLGSSPMSASLTSFPL